MNTTQELTITFMEQTNKMLAQMAQRIKELEAQVRELQLNQKP